MALDEIVAHKRAEVAARVRAHPLEAFRDRLVPSDRDFEAALMRHRTSFILECKAASPSRGTIRPLLDLDQVASAYGPHADAVSVLADARFFGGSLNHVTELSRRLNLPVLCKDVVVDPYQVYEARRYGADAILLMLSVLDDAAWRDCHDVAERLKLGVLTEVHTESELRRALALGARIIGINNRNLRTLEVDLEVTERLAPLVPRDRMCVAESGIADHRDVLRLRPLVDGFLAGTSLMIQENLARATRALIHGVTKVCGLTRPADAVAAHRLGATHGGLIFAPESPRRVDLERAEEVCRAAPLDWVGVFVNDTPDRITDLAERLNLAAVQLHGEEPPTLAAELRRRFNGSREVWRGVRVRERVPLLEETGADRLLLDRYVPGARGGTGSRFDWRLLAGFPDLGRTLLSGGLSPEMVDDAEAVGAWGLDVNSGVESGPGVKDEARLSAWFDARRGYGRKGRNAA